MESSGQSSKKKKRKRTEVQTEFVEPQNGFGCPFVGYFPSGYNPLKNGEDDSGLEVTAYQNTNKFKTKQLQVVARPKEANVDFVGTNFSGEGALWQPCNYLMGVFDKETKTLKLLPISGGKIFRMEARVRGLDYTGAQAEEEHIEELTAEERTKNFQLLTATFGTHKSRLAAKRLAKARLKEEALGDQAGIGKLFEAAAMNTAVLTNEEALAQANANIIRNIPPYDASATTPDKVYLLENIIFKEEWDRQYDVDELILAGKNVQKTTEFQGRTDYPQFVRNRIHKLRSENGKRQNRLAHVFSYITHLLNFKSMPQHAIRQLLKARTTLEHDTGDERTARLMESSKIPGVMLAKFLKLFSDSKGSTRSRDKNDLLISYILVLTLIADGFETEPLDVAKDLKMTLRELKPYYLELGCKVRSAKTNLTVSLPVPLTFPAMKPILNRR
eukprot:Gb_37524 [translate_table: standard]